MLAFVRNELLPYLSSISSPHERDIRNVVGTIFRGTYNRIRSGYILREVVDKLSTINFNSSDDIHGVSHFYELWARGDAALRPSSRGLRDNEELSRCRR